MPTVATFGSEEASRSCAQHFADAVSEFGIPTVVIDWESVDSAIFDPATLAAEVDLAVSTSMSCSVDEVFAADAPQVLGEVFALKSRLDWPAAVPGVWEPPRKIRPPDAFWQRQVARHPPAPVPRAWVPVTRNSSHNLPIELLADVASLVSEERSKAFLCDVLWCVTSSDSHAKSAIEAHYACATDAGVAKAHRAIESRCRNVDPLLEEVQRDQSTRQFQLAHLRRATVLAQVMNEDRHLEAIYTHARSLLSALTVEESPFEILDACGTNLSRVPEWWDEALARELARLSEVSSTPRDPYLNPTFDLAADRARARKRSDEVLKLRTEQINIYWRAIDTQDESGPVKAEWARHACELADRDVPGLVKEARRRYDAIDKWDGIEARRDPVEIPPEIRAFATALVVWIERLPDTLSRLQLLASSVDLFERFYETSDLYVHTPMQNSLMTFSVGPVERIAATAAQRESHSRKEQVHWRLVQQLALYSKPMFARILELFDPDEALEDGFEFFDEAARHRLKRCLELCKHEDYDTAAHLLAPLAERVLKQAVRTIGIHPIVPAPSVGGKANPGTLGTLLIGLGTSAELPHDFIAGLLFVLTGDVPKLADDTHTARPAVDGLNLRNDICHGEGTGIFNFTTALVLLVCISALGGLTTVSGKLQIRRLDVSNLMTALGVDVASFRDA